MDSPIDFLLLYQRLIDILPSGSLQELMEACYEIVGVSILVVDIMYNLLGIAPAKKQEIMPGIIFWSIGAMTEK